MASEDRASEFLERYGAVPKAVLEEFGEVLEVFSYFARDMLLLGLGGDRSLLLNPDFEDRLRAAAAVWDTPRLLGLVAELDGLIGELGKNMNKSLLATTFFSNVTELRHA